MLTFIYIQLLHWNGKDFCSCIQSHIIITLLDIASFHHIVQSIQKKSVEYEEIQKFSSTHQRTFWKRTSSKFEPNTICLRVLHIAPSKYCFTGNFAAKNQVFKWHPGGSMKSFTQDSNAVWLLRSVWQHKKEDALLANHYDDHLNFDYILYSENLNFKLPEKPTKDSVFLCKVLWIMLGFVKPFFGCW